MTFCVRLATPMNDELRAQRRAAISPKRWRELHALMRSSFCGLTSTSTRQLCTELAVPRARARRQMTRRIAAVIQQFYAATDTSDGDDEHADEDGACRDKSACCEICDSSDDAHVSLLCDGCDRVYHTFCIGAVPRNDWFCPACVLTDDAVQPHAHDEGSVQDDEEDEEDDEDEQEEDEDDAVTPTPEELHRGMCEMNELLVHACACDDAPCARAMYCDMCLAMKRLLQCMSWFSFNTEVVAMPFVQGVIELLVFHATHCTKRDMSTCTVPLCQQLQATSLSESP